MKNVIKYGHWLLIIWGIVLSIVTLDNHWGEYFATLSFVAGGVGLHFLMIEVCILIYPGKKTNEQMIDDYRKEVSVKDLYSSTKRRAVDSYRDLLFYEEEKARSQEEAFNERKQA